MIAQQASSKVCRVQAFGSGRVPVTSSFVRVAARKPVTQVRASEGSAAAPVSAPAAQPPAPIAQEAAPTAAESVGGPENVRLRIRMRGYDVEILKDAVEQIKQVCNLTGAEFIGPVMLPTKRRLYCVLTSPHVDKDAREHFEIRIHNRLVDLRNLSSQAITAMMEWEPPSGLEVECSVV